MLTMQSEFPISQTAQPDLSVYLAYPPEKLLPFWYGQTLTLPLSVWQELKVQAARAGEDSQLPCIRWIRFIETELHAADELYLLENNEELSAIGPFYDLPDKVSFCFRRHPDKDFPTLGAEEFFQRGQALHTFVPLEPLLQRMAGQRSKTTKRTILQPEELTREIQVCLAALAEKDRLQQQAESVKKDLRLFHSALLHSPILAPEPVLQQEMPKPSPPVSPELMAKSPSGLRNRLLHLLRSRKPSGIMPPNPRRRQYFLSLRVYENACERYKTALEHWPVFEPEFRTKVETLRKTAETRLSQTEKGIRLCSDILSRSLIHSIYQQPGILKTFLRYLETGRAIHLQSCINLYEEEQRWNDLKSSQLKIENTLLSWQPETGSSPVMDAEAIQLLHSLHTRMIRDA